MRSTEIDTTQTFIQVKGKITHFRMEGQRYKQRLVGIFTDGTGILELVWFKGLQWVMSNYQLNTEYIAFGRPTIFNNKLSIAHPELETTDKEDNTLYSPLQPQYSLTEKLTEQFHYLQDHSSGLNGQILSNRFIQFRKRFLLLLLKSRRLMDLVEAIRNIHFPENNDKLRKATYRLKFEELFYIQLNILGQKNKRQISFAWNCLFKGWGQSE